uniref:ABC1 domain-containing protein n=1 Tax=Angiostrongylus cantonensis TaxID=6313 RepID=A0A158PBF8_ANGCA
MPVKTSALRWCRDEIGPIFRGVQLIFHSQLGYEGRRLEEDFFRACLRKAVMGGTVIDPLDSQHSSSSSAKLPETTRDILQRANTVAVGIRTFAELASQGVFPGDGGYTVSPTGEKVYGSQRDFGSSVISELKKVAELVSKEVLSLPNLPLPNLLRLGSITQDKDRLEGLESGGSKNTSMTTTDALLDNGLTPEEKEFLINAAKSVGDMEAEKKISVKPSVIYKPKLPTNYSIKSKETTDALLKSRETGVPSTRIGRLASFGRLAVGLAGGAAAEVTRRTLSFGGSQIAEGLSRSPFLSSANADRIVQTLCRVRGAALKLGQMLSIQDPDTVPAYLLEIFERVRQSADFMPRRQVEKQMVTSFGADWRARFSSFEDRPFAAASIGQVHRAVLLDGRKVAVKIQYPGVAEVARKELTEECDYMREARAMQKFRELLADSEDFYVPEVCCLTTNRVITAEHIVGEPVDKCVNEPQVVRDYIAGKFTELCLREIFVWRFMQTDPNWSNFFLGVHPVSGALRMVLLDFGASRSYSKKFVDRYMKLIKAASDGDTRKIIEMSREIGFLTGYESSVMESAHVESVLIMGETLTSSHPYDFSRQSVTQRIHKLIPVMLEHRLTSPPEEIYSLHRKLSGSYLLATKLKAVVSCGGLFNEIYDKYIFNEDEEDINIDRPAECSGRAL